MLKLRHIILFLLVALLGVIPVAAQDRGPDPQTTDAFWEGAYWSNQTLSGEPSLRRADNRLSFDWGENSPGAGVPVDHFSARWTRYVEVPDPGARYSFVATSDDGIRVWVGEELIIDEWNDHAVKSYEAQIDLSPGHHLITVEYYENGGQAVAELFWTSQARSNAWRAEYFDNRWLSGDPLQVRHDASIDFNWGWGAPAPGMPSNNFSARWTHQVAIDDVSEGTYRFRITADDGIRLWVDGELVISEWSEHPAETFTADVPLAPGTHDLKVEYFESSGQAVAQLSFTPLLRGERWQAAYFNNSSLSGEPVLGRADAAIDFDWGYGSPAHTVRSDDFSVRWERTLELEPGDYRFTTTTDDGVRLWVDGQLLIDYWREQTETSSASPIIHLSGAVPVRMEYFERGGKAVARLRWEQVEGEDPPPPGNNVVVDEQSSGFERGGPSSGWRTAFEGYNGQLLWTTNSDSALGDYNWARWYPDLNAGRYEVFAYIPDRYTTTTNARYWIRHRDGYTRRAVDQSANGGRWISLGTYWFDGEGTEYVSLADVTYESDGLRLIAYDALRWERR